MERRTPPGCAPVAAKRAQQRIEVSVRRSPDDEALELLPTSPPTPSIEKGVRTEREPGTREPRQQRWRARKPPVTPVQPALRRRLDRSRDSTLDANLFDRCSNVLGAVDVAGDSPCEEHPDSRIPTILADALAPPGAIELRGRRRNSKSGILDRLGRCGRGDRRDDHCDRPRAHTNEVELFGVEALRVARLGNGSAHGARNPPCARGAVRTPSLPPKFPTRRARRIRRPPPLSTPRGIGPRIENRTSRDGSAKAPAVDRAAHAISPCGRGIVAVSAGRAARRVRSAGDRGTPRIPRDPSGVQDFASDGAAAYATKRSRAAYGMR